MARYKRNYLTTVVARVDFAISPDNLDRQLPDDLKRQICKKFPVPADPVDCIQTKLFMHSNEDKAVKTDKWKRWDFYTKRRNRQVRIEQNFFCLEYNKYLSFDHLKKDFLALTEWVTNSFPDATFGRLGLRYIDTFEFPKDKQPLNWAKWINRNLLASLRVPTNREKQFLVRTIQNLELNYGDLRLRFTYGISNPDYPSPIKRKQFIFDTDAFYNGFFEADKIPTMLDQFHTKIVEFFEANITEHMRTHLNTPKRK